MRHDVRLRVLFCLTLAAGVASGASAVTPVPEDNKVRVVYIEASTADAWKLDAFPERVGDSRYEIRLLKTYQFDKSRLVSSALTDRPDAIVIQECSVYFPGPLVEYKRMYWGWVDQVQSGGVRPILATVVPPAEGRGVVHALKEFIKVHVLGRERQIDQIVAFNAWLRQEAATSEVPLLDLEAALKAETGPFMDVRYDSGDGTHVNQEAYAKLDQLLLVTLRNLTSPAPSGR